MFGAGKTVTARAVIAHHDVPTRVRTSSGW